MAAEYEPRDESHKAWFYLGYYAARLVYRAGEVGERACRAIARCSSSSVERSLTPDIAPLALSTRDRAHLELLYEQIEYPYQLNEVILEVQSERPNKP